MSEWLTGKRALVIGGGSGIGRAVVDALHEEGASVCVLELDPDKSRTLALESPQAVVVSGDATTPEANRAAVARVIEQLGGLDVLISCVGVFDFYRRLEEIDTAALGAAFDEIFDVNVKSILYGVQAALPGLRSTRGNIVLTASTSAYYPGRGGTLYAASKFAVRGLVTTLAYELAPEVRVNAVAPGGTLGTDLSGVAALGLGERRLSRPDREQNLAARTPLHIAMQAADHAGSYVFLASDRACGITGSVVHSDGGMGIRT